MGLNSFFKFILIILGNLLIYFIVYHSLKLETVSSASHQKMVEILLKQDISVEIEEPIINAINVDTGDSDKDAVLRLMMVIFRTYQCFYAGRSCLTLQR